MMSGLFAFARLRRVGMIGSISGGRSARPASPQSVGAGLSGLPDQGQGKKTSEQPGPSSKREKATPRRKRPPTVQERRQRRRERMALMARLAGAAVADSAQTLTDGAITITDKADSASKSRPPDMRGYSG